MQNQPAWLRDDTQDEHPSAENGGPPSLADLSLHQRNASTGAADFVGLGGTEEPYANGDSHAQPGRRLCQCTALHSQCARAVRSLSGLVAGGRMQHHICPTRPSSCTKSLSLKRMRPLACGYACVMRQQWSTEAHRQHCCCNKLKYVGCGCYPHAPKQLLMYAGGWAQQNLLLECMTWLKMCRPCYCSSGACSSIICNQLPKTRMSFVAEPPGAPAAAAGEGDTAAAAAAAPASARDPLEDLLEPTPSAASPEPPKPSEAPTTIRQLQKRAKYLHFQSQTPPPRLCLLTACRQCVMLVLTSYMPVTVRCWRDHIFR